MSEEGQQTGGPGAEAGAETRCQGPDCLPQQVRGPGQDQPPQEEPTGNTGQKHLKYTGQDQPPQKEPTGNRGLKPPQINTGQYQPPQKEPTCNVGEGLLL